MNVSGETCAITSAAIAQKAVSAPLAIVYMINLFNIELVRLKAERFPPRIMTITVAIRMSVAAMTALPALERLTLETS